MVTQAVLEIRMELIQCYTAVEEGVGQIEMM